MSAFNKYNMNILKDICRLYNGSINQRKRYQQIKFAEEIFVLMKIDVKNECEQVHPQFLCNTCSRNLYRYRDTKVSIPELNLSLYHTFVPHSEECELCSSRKTPKRGRPKKRKTDDALFDPVETRIKTTCNETEDITNRTAVHQSGQTNNDAYFDNQNIVPGAISQNENYCTDVESFDLAADVLTVPKTLSLIPEETRMSPSSIKSPDQLITITGQTKKHTRISDESSQEWNLQSDLKLFEPPESKLKIEQITSSNLVRVEKLPFIGAENDKKKNTTNENQLSSVDSASEMKGHFDHPLLNQKSLM
ncbi:uncharacterized protein [Mytilus edulis]|uniref:uncharacterized protein n=1 Tax=Mytilus edulis TaxID=6550 RepID=UPI0039EFF6CC